MSDINVKTRTTTRPGNPWLGLAVIVILPILVPVNIILWKLAIG